MEDEAGGRHEDGRKKYSTFLLAGFSACHNCGPNVGASGSGSGSAGMTITTSPAPSSATSQMYRVRDSAWGEWATMRSSDTTRASGTASASASASAGAQVGTEAEGGGQTDRDRNTRIMQAQRAVVATGAIRAVRRDLPETPFPLTPDCR